MACDLKNPKLVSLAKDLARLRNDMKKTNGESVSAAADFGDKLAEARSVAEQGEWLKFVADCVKISSAWAAQLLKLAAVRAENPTWFAAVAPLGVAKVMRACAASAPFRWTLSATWTYGGIAAIDMTRSEFNRAVAAADPTARKKKRRRKPALRAEGVLADLKTLHTADPASLAAVVDWVAATYHLVAPDSRSTADDPPSAAEPSPATPLPSVVAPALPGVVRPLLPVPAFPIALTDTKSAPQYTTVLGTLRAAEAELLRLLDAGAKVDKEMKIQLGDAALDISEIVPKLKGAFVAGRPRR